MQSCLLTCAILTCNPNASPLPATAEEAAAIANVVPSLVAKTLPVLIDILEHHNSIRYLAYLGHTGDPDWFDASTGACVSTLCLTDDHGNPTPESPTTLASLIGSYSTANEGSLELVVLSACSTEAFGRLLIRAGIPHVVAWSTIVPDKAAKLFTTTLFSWLALGWSLYVAFERAREALSTRFDVADPSVRKAGKHHRWNGGVRAWPLKRRFKLFFSTPCLRLTLVSPSPVVILIRRPRPYLRRCRCCWRLTRSSRRRR